MGRRNAASVMLDILAGTKNKTAAEVAVEIVTDGPTLSGLKVLYTVLAANTARRAKVIDCTCRHNEERNMGLGQAVREVGSRLGCDEFHRSVSTQLAERGAVRRCVARVGQEGLEASTRVTELTSNRATDDQRTCKTCGTRGHLAKVRRCGTAQTPRNGSSKGIGRGSVCAETANSSLRHVQTAEKLVT